MRYPALPFNFMPLRVLENTGKYIKNENMFLSNCYNFLDSVNPPDDLINTAYSALFAKGAVQAIQIQYISFSLFGHFIHFMLSNIFENNFFL